MCLINYGNYFYSGRCRYWLHVINFRVKKIKVCKANFFECFSIVFLVNIDAACLFVLANLTWSWLFDICFFFSFICKKIYPHKTYDYWGMRRGCHFFVVMLNSSICLFVYFIIMIINIIIFVIQLLLLLFL